MEAVPMDIDSSIESRTGEDYEVFLSFHGNDTRKRFTDVLYTFLLEARVRTFIDKKGLHVGKTIGKQLIDCIKQSKISIPVFSKNYAASKWCLLELFEMVQMVRCDDCKIQRIKMSECGNCESRSKICGHTIIPVFYDVTTDDVKLKTEVYDQFFAQYNDDHSPQAIQQWKDALIDAGGLKGLELGKETDGHEGELVKQIIDVVLQTLKKSEVQLPGILVGMEHHKEKLKRFLNPGSSCTRILGIHGMVGIGKSTIAKVIFNELCKSYEFCCFLENFEEISKDSHHLMKLQSQFISDLSRVRFPEILNVQEGRNAIKDVIKNKRYLLVLDDMDKESHFEEFFGKCNLVHPGSQGAIVVTTRNMAVLNEFKKKCENCSFFEIYEPQLMGNDQSLRLFSNIAFNKDLPPDEPAITKIISTANGLPLALEYTAQEHKANLLKGSQEKGNVKRKGRENIPHEVVLKKLERCFHTLTDRQQDLFLDTACLFIGEDSIVSSEVDNMISSFLWDGCELYPKNNVHANVMKDRGVPSYMWEDCDYHPEINLNANIERSLIKIDGDNCLWMHPQVRDFGRDINRKESTKRPGKRRRLWLSEEAREIFEMQKGTETVLAICLSFTKNDLESRDFLKREEFGKLKNLRFLKAGSIDFEGNFNRLFSDLRWLQWNPSGNMAPTNCMLKNLVVLDLSESEIMDGWNGWSEIKISTKLKVLNLSKCNNLSKAPNLSTFISLERLILASCRSLGEISTVNLKTLTVLNISHCTILRGALDFSEISNLEHLDVNSCAQLTAISGFQSLPRLKYLDTSGCYNLETLPNLSHLRELKTLRSAECKKLTEILGLETLSLEHLDISGCINIVHIVPKISHLRLKEVLISRCNLTIVKALDIWNLKFVEILDVSWCTSEEHIEEQILDVSNLKKLKILNLAGFGNFYTIQGLEVLESLEYLNISDWETIQNLPNLSNLKNLKVIYAKNCKKLSEIRGLEELESFKLLYIFGCESLVPLRDLPPEKILQEYY